MKYGQRLSKYSVPEWRSHNILYDDLKIQIKELTASSSRFSHKGYKSLVAFFQTEIENTNLFVHCKLGEIEYRFQQCDNLVRELSKQPQDDRLYWQLSAEVQKINQEVRNLSRYIVAQYTGFRKLIKKYRRHVPITKPEQDQHNLSEISTILGRKDSFARVDLTSQFLELSILYSTLRTRQFNELVVSSRNTYHHHNGSHVACDRNCVETLAKFDVEMLTGLAGDVNRFWVHRENLVQLKVLLLEYMDAVTPPEKAGDENEITSVMYMDTDNLQSAREFGEPAQVRQVRITGETEWSQPVLLVPAGRLRHTASLELSDQQFEALKHGKYNDRCITSTSPSTSNVSAQLALGWVSSQLAQPIVSLKSHRTRFKCKGDSVWASIDDLPNITDTFDSQAETEIADKKFPYAVLEIRVKRDTPWVNKLRQSHLLFPVSSSFSLYSWALLRTRPKQIIARPKWLDMLDNGIDILREPLDIGVSNQSLNTQKSVASLQLMDTNHAEGNTGRSHSDFHDDDNRQSTTPRYWNEFDDGDEYEDRDGQFFEEIDEELRRARIAANLARPVYQLGETMRRQLHSWFDPSKKIINAASISENDHDIDSHTSTSIDSLATETSSLLRHQRNRRYSPRIPRRGGSPQSHEQRDNAFEYENTILQQRNDQVLSLLSFLCFCLSLGTIALVFTILVTEDVLLIPPGLRASLVLFLVIALALALLGYVAYNFRSSQDWESQVLIHIVLLTVVCFGVGGIANIAVPQI